MLTPTRKKNGSQTSKSATPHSTLLSVPPLLLSFGNSKISRLVAIFDLPALYTCPAAKACRNYCTSFKAQIGRWKGVPQARWRNFWSSLYDPYFVDQMVANIQASRVKFVRFHASGDLYNKSYIQKIAKIARRLPQVHFYLYTKSLHFDLRSLTALPNFTVIRSFGGHYDRRIKKTKQNYARVITDPKQQRPGEFLCPEGLAPLTGKARDNLCGYNCFYCLSDKKTDRTEPHQIKVCFLLRRAGWNGNKLPPPAPAPKPIGQVTGGVVK